MRWPVGAPVGLDPTGDCLALAQTGLLAYADRQAKEKPASGGSEAEAHVGAEGGASAHTTHSEPNDSRPAQKFSSLPVLAMIVA